VWKGFKGDRVSLSYRQALNRLLEVLEQPASVGRLHGVPSLPILEEVLGGLAHDPPTTVTSTRILRGT